MLNAQEDVITDVRMSIEIMTYVLQMSKLHRKVFDLPARLLTLLGLCPNFGGGCDMRLEDSRSRGLPGFRTLVLVAAVSAEPQ